MTTPAHRVITPTELAELPFGFLDPHWVHQDPPYSNYIEATWNTFTVWSTLPTGPWHWNADNKQLTYADWESFYPGYHLIDVTTNSIQELSSSYQGKLVKYNVTAERWEYLNHKPVHFPSPETDDPDVTEVSALLDSAITSVSRSRSALTPEQQKLAKGFVSKEQELTHACKVECRKVLEERQRECGKHSLNRKVSGR
jgi:hypothetical protein